MSTRVCVCVCVCVCARVCVCVRDVSTKLAIICAFFTLQVLVEDSGFPLSHAHNTKLRELIDLYNHFHDLAIDLRSTTADPKRASSFYNRVLKFLRLFQRVGLQACTHKVTYVHILLDHIPTWMVLWCSLLQVGYRVFSAASGEHLNKQVKFLELGHTDLSKNRFAEIMRLLRVRAIHYPMLLLDESSRDQTCSRCHQKGHNRKNKSCPMHPSHPPPTFSDSEPDECSH